MRSMVKIKPLPFFLPVMCCSVIYDPKAKDNEEKSAELFGEFAADALQVVITSTDFL